MTICKLLFVLVINITTTIAHIEKEIFKKDVLLANFLCPSATMDLGLQDRVTKCASSCSKTDTCRSFFYNRHSLLCKGSPEVPSTTTGCEFQADTNHFYSTDITTTTSTTTTTTPSTTTAVTTPSIQYGKPCTGVTDCTSSDSICLQNTCVCQVGFSYKSSTDSCLSSCETYGTTYSEYQNLDLDVIHIAQYMSISLDQCQVYCSESTSCRSVNFSGGMCRLKALMDLSSFRTFMGVDFYTRNCA